jgi:hypothetical protein
MTGPIPLWTADCLKEIVGETLTIGALSLVLFVTRRTIEALDAPRWAVHTVEQAHWITFTVAVVWLALGTVATIVYPDLLALYRSLEELTDRDGDGDGDGDGEE